MNITHLHVSCLESLDEQLTIDFCSLSHWNFKIKFAGIPPYRSLWFLLTDYRNHYLSMLILLNDHEVQNFRLKDHNSTSSKEFARIKNARMETLNPIVDN